MNTKRYERGQAMVLIVIGFIVILGFVGLAIDGGMVYSDRRHAQNAADAAALAAGGKIAMYMEDTYVNYTNMTCSDSRVVKAMQAGLEAAINRANSNGFDISETSLTDNNGILIKCDKTGTAPFEDRFIDITVQISTTTTAAFSRMLFDAPLISQVEAVTRARPRMPLAYGQAIVALNKSGCSGNQNGVQLGGSFTGQIKGGGIFSNGCLGGDGNKFSMNVQTGGVSYAGSTSGNMSNITPGPAKSSTMPEGSATIAPPDCGAAGVVKHNSQVKITNNDKVTLAPGLHCFYGSPNALSMTGGELIGNGVTIMIVGSGDFSVTGGKVSLSAPSVSPDPAPAIATVVIYSAEGDVELTGGGDSYFLGTVYVPKGDVKLTGSGGVGQTFNTQVIGYNVFVAGDAILDINYNANQNYAKPASLDLQR